MSEMLSLRQAARRFGVSERRLSRAVHGGELVAYQPGDRTILVRPTDVEAWLQGCRVRPWTPGSAR
jgi:excisionase family DNA binding protein